MFPPRMVDVVESRNGENCFMRIERATSSEIIVRAKVTLVTDEQGK